MEHPAELVVTNGVVQGQVVQVVASELFLNFGAGHGLQAGDLVQISMAKGTPITVQILDVWHAGARCALSKEQVIPSAGAVATAHIREVKIPRQRRAALLDSPRKADVLLAQWSGVPLERSRLISFDDDEDEDELENEVSEPTFGGLLGLEYSEVVNPLNLLGEAYREVSIRSELEATGLFGGHVDYSHRLRVRHEFVPFGKVLRYPSSRNALRVYGLRAGVSFAGTRADIGRTQASPLAEAGIIDGVSIRHALGEDAAVGAWAGAAPQLTGLELRGKSLAFGVYGSLTKSIGDEDDATRVNIDGGFMGTTWAGAIDRKAVAVNASVEQNDRWFRGHAVVEIGSPTSSSVKPSQLFADLGAQVTKKLRVDVRADQIRSVATAEVLDLLPVGYVSGLAFSSLRAGVNYRLSRGLYLSSRSGWRSAAEGAGSIWTSAAVRASGVLLGDDTVSFSVDTAYGTYVDGGSARIFYGIPIHRRLEFHTGYRLYGYRYGNENARFYRHQPSVGFDGLLPGKIHGSLDVDAYLGAERMVLSTFASLTRTF